MLAILISMIFGGATMKMVDHQTKYCECYRQNFQDNMCKEIKGSGLQGSCHK